MDLHMQCDASSGVAAPTICQLFVGHDGRHTALVVVGDRRLLRQWDSSLVVTDIEFTSTQAAAVPWAPGHPTAIPIVDDRPVKPSLAVVSANPKVIPTAKTADLHIAG
jgi:hypothetical protein